jgi:hypothetical protein
MQLFMRFRALNVAMTCTTTSQEAEGRSLVRTFNARQYKTNWLFDYRGVRIPDRLSVIWVVTLIMI